MEHPAKPGFASISHSTAKKLKPISYIWKPNCVGAPLRGGTEAIHWIWANYVPCPLQALAMPTSRNLAGAPSGVNNFGCSEYPNARRAHPGVPTPRLLSSDATGSSSDAYAADFL
jgi:hypothetical protein